MSESYALDEFDIKLLQHLQRNARMKNTDLAKELGVTEGAIRKRIAKLINKKYIEKFTIQVSEKLNQRRAVVVVQIDGNESPGTIREEILKTIPVGVEAIYETTGDIDLFVVFHHSNDDDLTDAIVKVRNVKGVKNTTTHYVLKRTKVETSLI